MEAERDPPQAWSLLVANACAGLMPTANSAGTVNNPPPPASASIKPASMATKKSTASSSGDTMKISTKLSITVHAHPVAPGKKAATEAVTSSQAEWFQV
ncbi:hypothetical protein D3C78_1518760 [compost metagenome]